MRRILPSAYLDVGAFGCGNGGLQVGVGDADDNVAVRVFDQGDHLFDESFGLGTGFIHFPVAGDNGFTCCLIHQ